MSLLSPLKNNRGSAVAMLFTLPIILLVCICFAFTGYFIQLKSRVRSTCLNETIAIQTEMIQNEKKLFAMNPLSTILRLRLLAAHAERAASIWPPNPFAFAKATADIKSIEQQREILDRTQKALINYAKVRAQISTAKMLYAINKHFREMNSFWRYFIFSNSSVQIAHAIEMAVEPDYDDTAPNYGLKDDYKSTQRLVLNWQHYFRTQDKTQTLLTSESSYAFSCGTSPNKKDDQWYIEIKGDKF